MEYITTWGAQVKSVVRKRDGVEYLRHGAVAV